MQKSFMAIVILQGCSGFAPHSNTMTKRSLKTSRPPTFSLTNEKATPNQGFDSRDTSDSNLILESEEPELHVVDVSVATSDVTSTITETLLKSINQNSPVVVLETVDNFLDPMESSQDPTVTDTGVWDHTKTATNELGVANIRRDDDVKAILEASGQAAAAAEASMPRELIEQLDFTITNTTSSVDTLPEILTAASVVGEPSTTFKIEPPKVSKILKFAIPAIGVWLCNPLLSLIDTSAVGLFSGTIQQAALNPAVAVTDYAALLIVSCLAQTSVSRYIYQEMLI